MKAELQDQKKKEKLKTTQRETTSRSKQHSGEKSRQEENNYQEDQGEWCELMRKIEGRKEKEQRARIKLNRGLQLGNVGIESYHPLV